MTTKERIAELVKKMQDAKNEDEYNAYRRQYLIEKDNRMRETGIDPITHNYIKN